MRYQRSSHDLTPAELFKEVEDAVADYQSRHGTPPDRLLMDQADWEVYLGQLLPAVHVVDQVVQWNPPDGWLGSTLAGVAIYRA